jgi:DNA polymerase III subunit gamma/tau
MSLYRKYRPQSFADVIGQDHVVTTLESAVSQKKLAHAYLFAGGRGTGKTSVARILAKTLLTQGIDDANVKKQILQGVEEGHLVDLVEIDAASNRGIDDVRDLIEKIQFSPVVATAKVYIVDEAHMLTKEAFNALLKTLEEPPPYAYFILATTELQKIPATIQSRCQRFAFRQITEEDIVRGLQRIADAEKITIDRPALRAVAHAAQGGMRDAISLLDQLRSLKQVTVEDVRQRTGETGQEFVEKTFEALAAQDAQTVLDVVRGVEDAGIALDVFLRQLLAECRRRLHAAAEAKQELGMHVRLLDLLLSAVREIRNAPVPGLALESALLRAGGTTVTSSPAPAAPKKDVKAVKVAPNAPTPASPAPPQPPARSEPVTTSAVVEAPDLSLLEIQRHWAQILKDIPTPSVRMSLKNGRVASVKDGLVRVAFSSAFHRDKVKATDASRQVEEVLAKIFKRTLRIECVLDGGGTAPSTPDEGLVNLAEAASEVF